MLQPKIINLETISGYKLKLYYDTGEEKIFDVSPYIQGDWYGRLKDEAYFKTVHILPGGIGIEWADGQDIAPHELYDASVARCM
jgi:hypothetical protein